MSTYHEVILKPIDAVAAYKKNMIPANIPEKYALKPMFEHVASETSIRNGVIAFRDFLYRFCDLLLSDGQFYAKPPVKPSGMADYPFLNHVTNILVDMGYRGKLSEDGNSLWITELPLCAAHVDESGKKKPPKIPVSGQVECFRFLSLCGFVFIGIDLDAKTIAISEAKPLEVSYPGNPILLTGLKALSIADMELRAGRRYWNDHNLLRCDYRLLKAEDTDVTDRLVDFLHPLPDEVRRFALQLHQRYTGIGMTCTLSILDDVSFSYAHIGESRKALSSRDKYQKRVWAFSYSLRYGYSLFVRAKKTDKYADVIKDFPLFLQEKITAGYGCYRKMGRERCQGDCQGIHIPLDDSVLMISKDIETWLDHEV
jgi:hypothetical protein